MLVCSRYIPKVCSGAVCARLFTGSAGEEKTQEVVRKFIQRTQENSAVYGRDELCLVGCYSEGDC